jgi:hypothetical protein
MLYKISKAFLNENKNLIKKYSWIALASSIFLYWIIPFLGKPYVIDEAAFPYAAKGVSENWAPFFYNGETRPNDLGTWHPPLYVYLLGIWIKLLGFLPETVRLFGIVCLVFTSLFVKLTIDLLRPTNKLSGLIGAGIYISHYFVIQSALIPDIDGTLLPLVIAISIFVITKSYKSKYEERKRFYFYTLLALGVSFSTKLTTTLILVSFYFILDLAKNRNVLMGALKTILLTIGGFLLFLSWWFPLAKIKGLNWLEPINFTINSFRGKSNNSSLALVLESMTRFPNSALLWIGPATFCAFLVALVAVFTSREKVNRPYLLALVYLASSIWLTYNAITGAPFTFPKYWNVPLIPVAILIGILWPINIVNSQVLNKTRIFLATFSLICFTGFSYTNMQNKLEENSSFVTFADLFLMAPVFIGIIFMLARKDFSKFKTLEILVVSCTLWIALTSISINSALVSQDFSTRYYFGERGELKIIEKVRIISTPKDRIMAPKDVGLQAGTPFFEDALLLNQFSPEEITEYLVSNKISLIVVRKLYDYSALVYPDHFSAINQKYKVIQDGRIGDFEIWRIVK